MKEKYPKKIGHWINDKEVTSGGRFFEKDNPANGEIIARVARGSERDVQKAIRRAEAAQKSWAQTPVIKRADKIREIVFKLQERRKEILRRGFAERKRIQTCRIGASSHWNRGDYHLVQ